MFKNVVKILPLVICLSLVLVACGGGQTSGGGSQGGSGSAENGGSSSEISKKADYDTLVYGMNTEPAKLDPQNDTLLNTMFVNKQIYDTLIVKDDITGEILPNLATEWEWEDDTTLVMTIRDDVYFHNGEKLTAEDVAFTIQRFPTGSATASLYSSFDAEKAKALDETHVEIKLKEAYGPALNMLASMKAAIVSKNYFESVDDNTFTHQPVGSGPFKFVSWVSGDRINLERNDNYWGHKPSYKNLVMRAITDATARAIELETGGVDIIDTMNGSDMTRFEGGKTAGVNLYTIAGYKIHYIVFNEANPILANPKVRQAVGHAIEIEPITEAGFGVSAVPAQSSMATTIFGFKPTGPHEYDVEKAKELLAEAGYPDGFSVEMVIPDLSNNIRMAEAIQAYLKEIGINMGIKSYDAATWMTLSREGEAQITIQNLTADSGDPDHSYMYLYKDSSMKTIRTQDEVVNRLLNEGKAEIDEAKRKEIYSQLQDYIFENAIWLPIDEPIINFATRDYILNFTPNAGVQVNLAKIDINH